MALSHGRVFDDTGFILRRSTMQSSRAFVRSRARSAAVAALCGGALLLASSAALADEFQDHLDKATVLAQSERYRDALVELEAAYTLRQSPRVLYMLAKTQQRLGDTKAALSTYERFLAADADPDPRPRADAQEQVARLKHLMGKDSPPAVSPPVGPLPVDPRVEEPPVEVHYEMKPSVGLMAGGAVLFGSAYLGAVISGSIFLAPGNNNMGCSYVYQNGGYMQQCTGGSIQVAAGTLLIPVLGPIIAAFAYRDPTWSTSWPLVDGVAQVAGVAMMIYAARHPKKVPVYGERFQILPYTAKDGGGLQAIGRF
jgi:hypothetical protein